MNVMTALTATDRLMTSVIDQLVPEHRENPTPCTEWNVHDVIDHVVGGCHMVASGLRGEAMADDETNHLADGPGKGWATAYAALTAAATPEVLAADHDMPFGRVTGEQAVSLITADAATHAWDIARGADVDFAMSDDMAEWVLATWRAVIGPDARPGRFAAVVPVADDAPALDRLLGFTGRQP